MHSNALIYFLEVVSCGSLNKAAKKLYISLPALRSSLSSLEKELGAPLIKRTKYGSEPTDFGKKVAEEAPILLKYIADWEDYAKKNVASEEITIYATRPFCSTVIIPVTTLLKESYPNLKFSIDSTNTLNSVQLLKNRMSQLAIIHVDLMEETLLREELQISDSYCVTKILESKYLALINQRSMLSEKERIEIADFKEFAYTNVYNMEVLSQINYLKTGFPSTHQPFFCDSHHSIYQIINDNANYYSLLSDIFASNVGTFNIYTQIELRPIDDFSHTTVFYLIYPSTNSSKILPIVCDAIKAYCDNL